MGFELFYLFTMHDDGEGGHPQPGDAWVVDANDALVTDQGGVAAGAGVVLEWGGG